MMESTPEWGKFENDVLSKQIEVLKQPLGGKDPRVKIESLFDDEAGGIIKDFQGFKPVNVPAEQELKAENESSSSSEEQEQEEEERDLDEEDFDKYFDDNETGELKTQEEGSMFSKTQWMSSAD